MLEKKDRTYNSVNDPEIFTLETELREETGAVEFEIKPICVYSVTGKTRACLKKHFRNLQAPLCGIFYPHSVAVARYAALIRIKSPTNWDSHLTKSLFQTRSRVNDTGEETFGLLCFAEITEFAKELHSEMEKVVFMNEMPENWTYPLIQPKLIEKYLQVKKEFYNRNNSNCHSR